MTSSSSIQSSSNSVSGVNNIAEYDVSPNKQAKIRQWQGTQTPSGDRMKKKTLGECMFSLGINSLLARK